MSPLRTIAMCLVACALQASVAMAQYKNPPGGLPGASPPGVTLPPMPSMPSAPAPSITLPPPPMAPDVRAPAIVVPPPPPPRPAEGSRDGGGPEACDCYRMVDGKRVLTGKNVACCPK